MYFACGKAYLIKNVVFKLQEIVSQQRNRLLNIKTCYYVMTWTNKDLSVQKFEPNNVAWITNAKVQDEVDTSNG